jgi:hypothetical protein
MSRLAAYVERLASARGISPYASPTRPAGQEVPGPGITGDVINAIDQGTMEAELDGSPLRICEHGVPGAFSVLGIPLTGTAERVGFLDPVDPHRPPHVAPRFSPLPTDVARIGFDVANGSVIPGTGKAAGHRCDRCG